MYILKTLTLTLETYLKKYIKFLVKNYEKKLRL